MSPQSAVDAVAHAIQLSVAPVFLLSGIGAMMAVLANRLARVVDRARVVEGKMPGAANERLKIRAELRALAVRAKIISWAIGLCTLTALLISSVVAILFLGAFVQLNASLLVALLFVAGMTSFICALLLFLREVLIATANLRFGAHRHEAPDSPH